MLTQSAAATGWVNERGPTEAPVPGNSNQPLNHTHVIKKFTENFTENLNTVLSFISFLS